MKPIYLFFILAIALSGCTNAPAPNTQVAQAASETPLPIATATPLATLTTISTVIPTPTFTLIPVPRSTDTPIPTPEPKCAIQDGKWESEQETEVIKGRLLTFEVLNCAIFHIEILAFPAYHELDMISEKGIFLPIENNQWIYTHPSREGELTLVGTFNSNSFSSGTFKYTKGYFIVDYTLTKDVEIPWTAKYISSPSP